MSQPCRALGVAMAANAWWVDVCGHEASWAALSLPWFSSAGRAGGRLGSESARPCRASSQDHSFHWPPGCLSSQRTAGVGSTMARPKAPSSPCKPHRELGLLQSPA